MNTGSGTFVREVVRSSHALESTLKQAILKKEATGPVEVRESNVPLHREKA